MKITRNPVSTTPAEAESSLESLAEAMADRGEPIKVRLQPQLYHPSTTSYRSWRLLTWTAEPENLEELLAFRESLQLFMDFLGRYGPQATEQYFRETLAGMAGEQADDV